MTGIRRWLCCGVLFSTLAMAMADSCLAQPTGNNQLPPSNTEVRGKSFVVEALIVVALMGGALFAVCRSSRRT